LLYEKQCLKFTAATIQSVQTAIGLTDTKVSEGIKKRTTESTNSQIIWKRKIKLKLNI
jgi:hypothetical protein